MAKDKSMAYVNRHILLFYLLLINSSLCDGKPPASWSAIGWQTGYGFQHGLKVDYLYKVAFFQLKFSYQLIEKTSWSFEVIPQPQLNFSTYKVSNNSSDLDHGSEFGLNIGFAIRKKFTNDQLAVYLLLGSGPHYVSGVPERQSGGFIFSDNAFIGMQLHISRQWFLDFSGGFRHISNAGIKRPNGGINNLVVMAGLSRTLIADP